MKIMNIFIMTVLLFIVSGYQVQLFSARSYGGQEVVSEDNKAIKQQQNMKQQLKQRDIIQEKEHISPTDRNEEYIVEDQNAIEKSGFDEDESFYKEEEKLYDSGTDSRDSEASEQKEQVIKPHIEGSMDYETY